MAFELTASFLTGIDHLDGEHRELMARINSIADLERSRDTAALIRALLEFRADLTRHFEGEEAHLKDLSYPKLSSHAKHHAEIIVALERLTRGVEIDEPIEAGVANVCFHELISAVLLNDMQFINWLADNPNINQHKA
jgi:hemerythrin-like metal-binding protein